MRCWFGSYQSTALFEFSTAPSAEVNTKLALHSHGTEMALQLTGDSRIIDERGRYYTVRQGDVILIKANQRHSRILGAGANRILSVVTPPRPECMAGDGTAYFSGDGQPAAAVPSRPDHAGPVVRKLFNMNEVEAMLPQARTELLAFRHWQGDDVSVALTRLRTGEAGHLRAPHAVHGEEVTFLLRGQMTLTQGDGTQVTALAGQLIILPPYRVHSAQCLSDDCLLLSWHAPRREQWGAEGSLPDVRFLSTGGGAVAGKVYTECPCQPGQSGESR